MNSSPTSRLNVAAWIFVAVAVLAAAQVAKDLIPNHAFDTTWPVHARFHVIWGAANHIGFALLAAAVALFPLRRGEAWSWWALLLWVLLGNYSIFVAMLLQPGAVTLGPIYLTAMAAGYSALLVALGLSFRVAFPSSDKAN